MGGSFGELIEAKRREKRITLRKLAELVGLAPSFISEVEHGRRLPPKDDETIGLLAKALDVGKSVLTDAAKRERQLKSTKFPRRLFDVDPDLAWGFNRAVEESSDKDKLRNALRRLLKDLDG